MREVLASLPRPAALFSRPGDDPLSSDDAETWTPILNLTVVQDDPEVARVTHGFSNAGAQHEGLGGCPRELDINGDIFSEAVLDRARIGGS